MPNIPVIEHVIVLMLENRSFDHLIGYLKQRDPRIDGITGDEFFNRDSTGEPIRVSPTARFSGDFDPDPGHDFDDVEIQMYGQLNPAAGQAVNMSGFVNTAVQISRNHA